MKAARFALLLLAAAALVSGIAGGLARAGMTLPAAGTPAVWHGALMIAGFLGTVISLERAVALGRPLALAAPLASAAGTLALLASLPALAFAAWLLGSILLAAVSAAILRRQAGTHTRLLVLGAVAWCIGNAVALARGIDDAGIAWWFVFLVLTIAAERLEMTRLMKRRPVATPLLAGILGLLGAAAAAIPFSWAAGTIAFGAALVALAAWLAAFDLARRTVRTSGFARYAAVALLAGYGWLAVSGLAWIAVGLGATAARDAALHALGLGFIVSMIFAHAPLVVPVIAGVRMRYSAAFYAPLFVLHGSLLVRLLAHGDASWHRLGAELNAAAIALFVAVLLPSILAARHRAP
jgi:hypothetical protein